MKTLSKFVSNFRPVLPLDEQKVLEWNLHWNSKRNVVRGYNRIQIANDLHR